MTEQESYEPFCLDVEGEPDLSDAVKKRNRTIGYITSFLVVFTLGTTEVFASWYAGILGGTSLESGLAVGMFGFMYIFSSIAGGRISDKIGRKKTLTISTAVYVVVILFYLLPSIAPIHLIVIRSIEGIAFGFIAPIIEGMVAELDPEAQAAALGNFSTAWSASMILPPFIIAYTAGAFGGLSSIYIIIAVELLSLVIIAGFLQGYRRKTPTQESEGVNGIGTDDSQQEQIHSKTSPRFIASYISLILWGVVSTVILALFPTYIENLIVLGHPFVREDFGNLLLIWNAARTVCFIVTARLDERHMVKAIVLGAILSAISGIMLFLFVDIWIFTAAMIISGVGVGFSYLGALYLVVSATEFEKGSYAGLVESMGGVGLFIGPIVGGWLMGFGLTLPYLMFTGLSLVALLVMVPLFSRSNK
ncbi:MAG: MFS transporter [Candidatus Thorarchaeota archaeon]